MKKILSLLALVFVVGCSPRPSESLSDSSVTAFVGAKLIDGTGGEPIENAILLVSDGRIVQVGSLMDTAIPDGTVVVDVSGKVIMPGLINGHGHVGMSEGLDGNKYSRENVIRDLGLYARYGVTTVVSLGGGELPSIEFRNAQNVASLDRSRLFVAGRIVTGRTPEEARAVIDENHAMAVDFIKIRVDGAFDNPNRMSKEVYTAVMEHSHSLGIPVASHLYYLEDAKSLLEVGTDFIAHSIRDQLVDDEVIALMKRTGVYYSPTLMRDVSTFVYESEPEFFSDPFFLREADAGLLEELRDPDRQERIRNNRGAQANKIALDVALKNLKILADAGIPIVMGTDTGPPARFCGYFEHLEMEMMVEDAGMSAMDVIVSATGGAAKALKLEGIGTLETGNWADFLVLAEDPIEDISNTRSLESVWIAGNEVPERDQR